MGRSSCRTSAKVARQIWSGKNKLFFFTDLERTTQRNAAAATASVAPASLRPDANGNVNFTGTGITVYDPASNPNPALRTPFPNNTIPANRIDIAALEILRRLPLPNAARHPRTTLRQLA